MNLLKINKGVWVIKENFAHIINFVRQQSNEILFSYILSIFIY
jgi:hypothetical protein